MIVSTLPAGPSDVHVGTLPPRASPIASAPAAGAPATPLAGGRTPATHVGRGVHDCLPADQALLPLRTSRPR